MLFFFCKYDDPQRDNFLALTRGLLAQFVRQDKTLLHYFYQKCCESGESSLTSPTTADELLGLAFKNCKKAYIILDGLDECPKEQRKIIVQWFKALVESLPTTEPDRLRCLFVSQDDGTARKDFSGVSSLKIEADDNRADIEEYCQIEAAKLKDRFKLTDERASEISSMIVASSEGTLNLRPAATH